MISKKDIDLLKSKYNVENKPEDWLGIGRDRFICIKNEGNECNIDFIDSEGSLDGRNHYRNMIKNFCNIKEVKDIENLIKILSL